MVFGAPGAPQTPEIDDFRPAQNSCIKNPGVKPGNKNYIEVSDVSTISGGSGAAFPSRFGGSRGSGPELKIYIFKSIRFDLDTLRVANRSPTPASKINDFLGLFDDIWGVRGRRSRPIWGIPGVRAGIKNIYF